MFTWNMFTGASCSSLMCADDTGETNDGERRVPQSVIDEAYKWIEDENLDY